MFRRHRARLILTFLFLATPLYAAAHVKWFSTYSFTERPLGMDEIVTPLFWVLFGASVLGVAATVFIDEQLTQRSWYAGLTQRLARWAGSSDLILRVAIGGVLLLSWQSGSLLVPEVPSMLPGLDLVQLVLALAILSNRMVTPAGYGLIGLYLLALWRYGPLHMLDYLYLVGAAYYLVVAGARSAKVRASGLPLLYASVGFSLSWVGLEKLVYPQWALSILEERPFLTLGFDPAFFLTSAAFVEFTLGYLLIVCLVQRPLAIAITMLFMSTTLVFGKLEFVGHGIVHAALIVFVLQGRGQTFRTPITFFYHMKQRLVFAVIAFVAFQWALLGVYSGIAEDRYASARASDHAMPMATISLPENHRPPTLALDVAADSMGGWNVHLITEHFRFVPERAGSPAVYGEGHAHLYIDDRKTARIYGPWHHIPTLPPGTHDVLVTLNSNDHRLYARGDSVVAARATIVVR